MGAFQHEMGGSAKAVDDKSDWYVWLHDTRNIDSKVASGDVPELGPGYWNLYKEENPGGSCHFWLLRSGYWQELALFCTLFCPLQRPRGGRWVS